jgi:molybdenum cofactor cytidylyltransferase
VVWAVILAAGRSRRMGTPKLLLPYEGTCVVQNVVRKVRAAGVPSILVVLGAEGDSIKNILKDDSVKFVLNPDFSRGMLSSVQSGLRALPRAATWVMVLLGDQPALSESAIRAMLQARKRTTKGILIPVYKGKRGHPLLFDLKYKKEVLALDPAIGLRQLLNGHPDDVMEVEIPDGAVLSDIDTPEDYRRALAAQANKSRRRDVPG